MGSSGSLKQVVDGGFCIGCGACAALDCGISMHFDDIGRLQASLPVDRAPRDAALAACPFSGVGPDEDELARSLYSATSGHDDKRIGRHIACFAGWVQEGSLRERGSSGGIGTWLQRELLTQGLVDAVLNVIPVKGDGKDPMFSFTISKTAAEVEANAKTRYYPVEMSGVISYVISNPGRYAAIGIPCFAKALRLAALQSSELSERLLFVLGIVCGHLKTASFARSLALQCGIDPDGISEIDFRTKLPGRSASDYGVSVKGARSDGSGDTAVTSNMKGLIGANWGHGLFKYEACEFCDDVMAETADAVVGDAWLPAYDRDSGGTNVVVVRNLLLLNLLEAGREEGRLHLDDLTADDVASSQAGGLRHRRAGLAYRLWLADRSGRWRPKKRIAASRRHLPPAMRRIYAARYALGQASHEAWSHARAAGDMRLFMARISPKIAAYDRLMSPSFPLRALGFIERKLDALLFRLGIRQ